MLWKSFCESKDHMFRLLSSRNWALQWAMLVHSLWLRDKDSNKEKA